MMIWMMILRAGRDHENDHESGRESGRGSGRGTCFPIAPDFLSCNFPCKKLLYRCYFIYFDDTIELLQAKKCFVQS